VRASSELVRNGFISDSSNAFYKLDEAHLSMLLRADFINHGLHRSGEQRADFMSSETVDAEARLHDQVDELCDRNHDGSARLLGRTVMVVNVLECVQVFFYHNVCFLVPEPSKSPLVRVKLAKDFSDVSLKKVLESLGSVSVAIL